jgi:uncharacterized protein (DUF885 family)
MVFRAITACLLLLLLVPGFANEQPQSRVDLEARLTELEKASLPPDQQLDRFIQWLFDYTIAEYPTFASSIGEDSGHDRWTDNSLKAHYRREKMARRILQFLETFDEKRLDEKQLLDYQLLLDDYRRNVEGQRFKGEYLVITQMGGVHTHVARTLAAMPTQTIPNYENILKRLEGIPALIDNVIERLQKGLEVGVTPPKVTLRDVARQIFDIAPEKPLESPLLRPFSEFPKNIDSKTRQRLTREAVEIYAQRVRPALIKLHGYWVSQYLPKTRTSISMKDLPDGTSWYGFRVKHITTTELSPEQIHELGRQEVKRIRKKMDELREILGFDGNHRKFVDYLLTDPRFYYENREDLIRAYREISKRIDPELVRYFTNLPRLPYGVEPIPEYSEKSMPTAYYESGSLKAGRPGIFFANAHDLKRRPKWEMTALVLHEAVPGHHLQISLQQEIDGLAWFRRHGSYGAYTEGWALYAEGLGEEMGVYHDDYELFGRLAFEIWRAVRLVVDTGIHYYGWSREQAIDYFFENSPKTRKEIEVEVDRYIVWPGQALSYKIGELKIRELRARASRVLGDKFQLRTFHDIVLAQGPLPLSVLDQQIDQWLSNGGQAAFTAKNIRPREKSRSECPP